MWHRHQTWFSDKDQVSSGPPPIPHSSFPVPYSSSCSPSPLGILQLWPRGVSRHSCTPRVETVAGLTRGSILPPWCFELKSSTNRERISELYVLCCSYFSLVLRGCWDLEKSTGTSSTGADLKIGGKNPIVKSFQWRGLRPLASTIETRGMGSLLNSFLVSYPFF